MKRKEKRRVEYSREEKRREEKRREKDSRGEMRGKEKNRKGNREWTQGQSSQCINNNYQCEGMRKYWSGDLFVGQRWEITILIFTVNRFGLSK